MSYRLGIDVGTAYTAAAVWRDGRARMVDLGTHAPVVPSVALLRDDGEILVGEAAERRAATEPERVARAFKRRLGDPTAIVLAGTPITAEVLTAHLLRWTAETVAGREGGPPEGVVVTHPANWREFKQDLLLQAVRDADLGEARLLSEPEAAAIHYAAQERLPAGAIVAVYDLGGGTFDASVLRKADDGWELLGRPEGIERLGGVDFDEALFQHVVASLGDAFDQLDPDDPAAVAAVARLRRECVEAKEALASDSPVTVPVLLPSVDTEVRVTRGEFEDLIRPVLSPSVDALHRALRSAQVESDDLHAVLLVGGSSRLLLVAELVSAELGRPIAVDVHPKHTVALGAATLAAAMAGAPLPVGDAGAAGDGAAAALRGDLGVAAPVATAAAVTAAAAAGSPDGAPPDGAPPVVADDGVTGTVAGAPADLTEPLPVAGHAEDATLPGWAAPVPVGGGHPGGLGPDAADEGDRAGDDRPARRSRALVGALAAAAILLVGGGVAVALSGGGDSPEPPPVSVTTPPERSTTTAPTTTAPPTTETEVVTPPTTAPPVTEPPPPTTGAPTTTSSTTSTTTSTTTTTVPDPDDAGPDEGAAPVTAADPAGGES
jgi:actin-like ATPase involved in cell morphogenesis